MRGRVRREYQRDVFIAWQTAAFVPGALMGKLQPFSSVLAQLRWNDDAPVKEKAAAIAATFGIPIRPISDAAKQALVRLRERG